MQNRNELLDNKYVKLFKRIQPHHRLARGEIRTELKSQGLVTIPANELGSSMDIGHFLVSDNDVTFTGVVRGCSSILVKGTAIFLDDVNPGTIILCDKAEFPGGVDTEVKDGVSADVYLSENLSKYIKNNVISHGVFVCENISNYIKDINADNFDNIDIPLRLVPKKSKGLEIRVNSVSATGKNATAMGVVGDVPENMKLSVAEVSAKATDGQAVALGTVGDVKGEANVGPVSAESKNGTALAANVVKPAHSTPEINAGAAAAFSNDGRFETTDAVVRSAQNGNTGSIRTGEAKALGETASASSVVNSDVLNNIAPMLQAANIGFFSPEANPLQPQPRQPSAANTVSDIASVGSTILKILNL